MAIKTKVTHIAIILNFNNYTIGKCVVSSLSESQKYTLNLYQHKWVIDDAKHSFTPSVKLKATQTPDQNNSLPLPPRPRYHPLQCLPALSPSVFCIPTASNGQFESVGLGANRPRA